MNLVVNSNGKTFKIELKNISNVKNKNGSLPKVALNLTFFRSSNVFI